MAYIADGANAATLATVDPTSKALRGTLYDSYGVELRPPPVGTYYLGINLVPTAAVNNSYLLLWTAPASLSMVVRKLRLTFTWVGTAAATEPGNYCILEKLAPSIIPAGGTALTPVKKKTSMAASGSTFSQLNTGFSFANTAVVGTDVEFRSAGMAAVSTPSLLTGVSQTFNFNWSEQVSRRRGQITFPPGAMGGFRMKVLLTAGYHVTGCMIWDEI